jgi:myosin heavy subunit
MARLFMGKRRTEMPPHLFAVSDQAYRNMLQNHENQSMLITVSQRPINSRINKMGSWTF